MHTRINGPGLNNARRATISSNFVAESLLIRSFMLGDSSWKTAVVFPADKSSKTLESFKSKFDISRGSSFLRVDHQFIDLIALSIIVRVLSPKNQI